MTSHAFYPVYANLAGRRCLVVGGGLIAQRKVTTLRKVGALVSLVSPAATKRLAGLARQRRIRWVRRRFRVADLRGAWLVIAATDDQRINELVYRGATRRRIFTNVVDQKPLCSFITPSIVRRGPLTIAISTGGASPAMSKKLRRDLEQSIGHDYVVMVKLLASLRGVAKRTLPGYNDRKRYFDRLVGGRVFGLVRKGDARRAKREALALLKREASHNGVPR